MPYQIQAYELDLPSRYPGETTLVYHDEQAILDGRRQRGDHTGLLVDTVGQTMVCARATRIYCGLPTTPALTLEQAKDCEEENRLSGWRSFFARGAHVSWHSLGGHPVIRHDLPTGERFQTLLWRMDDQRVRDFRLDRSVALESVDQLVTAPVMPSRSVPGIGTAETQLGLFG
jgi:hypothetical protein